LKFKTPLVILVALYFLLGYAVGRHGNDKNTAAQTEITTSNSETSDVVAELADAPPEALPVAQSNTIPQAARTVPVKPEPKPVRKSTPPSTQTKPDQIWKVSVAKEDASMGPANAPLTCVFFSAFGCANCKTMSGAPEKLVKKYGKQVRVVFKHKVIPLSHPASMEASIAALAAKKQGKFWQFHDRLFAASNSQLNNEGYLTIAKQLGLNLARFKKDLSASAIRAQVLADSLLANQVGAHSMPNVLCNGVRMRGSKSFEAVASLAAQELPKARRAIKSGIKPNQLYGSLIKTGKAFEQMGSQQLTFNTAASPALGPKKAKVEVVVFEDFQ